MFLFFFRGSLVESPGVAKSYLGSQDDGMTGDFSFRFFSVSRGVNNPPWVFIASFFLAQFRKTWEEWEKPEDYFLRSVKSNFESMIFGLSQCGIPTWSLTAKRPFRTQKERRSSSFAIHFQGRAVKLGGCTWRIIPFSKWLITMVIVVVP